MLNARGERGAVMFLGLRTVIYAAPDLAASKAWYTAVLGIDPYFDEKFYVGFNVAGYELALDPHADPEAGPITYWGVSDADAALAALLDAGAAEHAGVRDVGDGIRVATVREPGGAVLGIIENAHFKLDNAEAASAGPGR
jgi:catechol 2,3-dioxygenase-like lactoylglutathione lyase family enzyme